MTSENSTATGVPEWVRSQRQARGLCIVCGERGDTTWAGNGDVLCWEHCEKRRAR